VPFLSTMPNNKRVRNFVFGFRLIVAFIFIPLAFPQHEAGHPPAPTEKKDAGKLQAVAKAALGAYANEDIDAAVELLKIIRAHSEKPLRAFMGEVVDEYDLSKPPIAILTKSKTLLILNWKKKPVAGMSLMPELTEQMGAPVYELKGISTKQIDRQGDDGQFMMFTYLPGSADAEDPTVHPNLLPKTHPLRQALNQESLFVYNPDGENTREILKLSPNTDGRNGFRGYKVESLRVFVHEVFHGYESFKNNLQAVPVDIVGPLHSKMLEELDKKSDGALILAVYKTEISKFFAANDDAHRNQALANIDWALKSLKEKFPETYASLKYLEYGEGEADFAATRVLVAQSLQSRAQAVTHLLEYNSPNNLFYTTGALGLLVANELNKNIPRTDAHDKSIWEIYLQYANLKLPAAQKNLVETASKTVAEEIKKDLRNYGNPVDDEEEGKPKDAK
jgi:hypothetical protein